MRHFDFLKKWKHVPKSKRRQEWVFYLFVIPPFFSLKGGTKNRDEQEQPVQQFMLVWQMATQLIHGSAPRPLWQVPTRRQCHSFSYPPPLGSATEWVTTQGTKPQIRCAAVGRTSNSHPSLTMNQNFPLNKKINAFCRYSLGKRIWETTIKKTNTTRNSTRWEKTDSMFFQKQKIK